MLSVGQLNVVLTLVVRSVPPGRRILCSFISNIKRLVSKSKKSGPAAPPSSTRQTPSVSSARDQLGDSQDIPSAQFSPSFASEDSMKKMMMTMMSQMLQQQRAASNPSISAPSEEVPDSLSGAAGGSGAQTL